MRIALAQIVSTVDPDRNLGLVEQSARNAATAGARLVVLPEATMCAFGVPLGPVAQPLDGPWANAVRRIAADHRITVVVGMFTPTTGGRVRNTLLVTGDGVDASYDKIHLFDAFGFRESTTVAPGTTPVIVEADGVTIGLAICYDLRFPGLFQALAADGAKLIVVPASWGAGEGKREQWDLLVRARALDSTSFVAACGQADPTTVGIFRRSGAPTGIGASAVVSPHGSIVEQLGAAPGLLIADLDLDEVDAAREQNPVLANRRF